MTRPRDPQDLSASPGRPVPNTGLGTASGVPAAGALTANDLRAAVGRFVTGVCVLTTVHEQVPHAMTANSFTSVSLDPLLVLVCVQTRARFHEAVLATGTWAVTVLDDTSREVSRWLATAGRPLPGQLDGIATRPGPVTGSPLLASGVAWLECRTFAVHPGGDHSVLIGEVVGAESGRTSARPLVWYSGDYRTVTGLL